MNAFRPDAEQVSIHIKGTEQEKTIIHGSVYLGGNSATIKTQKEDPLVQLKIGSYVIEDKVFMGNNVDTKHNIHLSNLYSTIDYYIIPEGHCQVKCM